jgi:predicted nucleotide-binding protein
VPPAPVAPDAPAPPVATSVVDAAGPIFIVHGHEHSLLYQTQMVLERATGREVVVLHQRADSGMTLIEKFERQAEKAAFAVVLLTADDEGGAKKDGARRPRGRQNVIFELGFFYAKLGRNRVAVLVDQDVEEPSDLRGLLYIPIDPGGGWKERLSKDLVSAGIAFDWSNVP